MRPRSPVSFSVVRILLAWQLMSSCASAERIPSTRISGGRSSPPAIPPTTPSNRPASYQRRTGTTSTSTAIPTSTRPSTYKPTTNAPSRKTNRPTSARPTMGPTTKKPSTSPTTQRPTSKPSARPSTRKPTMRPTTKKPTASPTTQRPTSKPSARPSTRKPTMRPTTKKPTASPTTQRPTNKPSARPSTKKPTSPPAYPPHVEKISFVVMGDVPYQKDHRYCLNKQLRELNQGMMDFKFMVHVGDIKHGHTSCYESSFSDVADIFSHESNAINYDLRDCFFVPGDNEFQDCQDKHQAYRWWMKYFGNGIIPNTNEFATLSDPNIEVEYQKSTDGSVYNEGNFAFFAVNTLFVGINQVGGGTVGDESTRVNGNYIWVQNNMAKYLSRGMRGIVIFAHASMGSSRQQYFGTPFTALLKTSAYAGIKALYVHGDGHEYNAYYPDSNNRNLTSVQVDGGEAANPLLISFVYDTVSNATSYNINRRGGLYIGACPAGNTDKTWSSNY